MTRRERIQFFYREAGYSYDPKTETERQGRMRCARALASAEIHAEQNGWIVEWVPDPDADRSWMDEETRRENQEAFGAILYTECSACGSKQTAVASLWGIFEPSDEYRRVVAAELALEAKV